MKKMKLFIAMAILAVGVFVVYSCEKDASVNKNPDDKKAALFAKLSEIGFKINNDYVMARRLN